MTFVTVILANICYTIDSKNKEQKHIDNRIETEMVTQRPDRVYREKCKGMTETHYWLSQVHDGVGPTKQKQTNKFALCCMPTAWATLRKRAARL